MLTSSDFQMVLTIWRVKKVVVKKSGMLARKMLESKTDSLASCLKSNIGSGFRNGYTWLKILFLLLRLLTLTPRATPLGLLLGLTPYRRFYFFCYGC